MPNMQRLTDTGICMHSGNLPGYPASHGCIRMPFDFSQLLFSATAQGGTVVVGDGKVPVPHLASSPGLLLAPKDLSSATVRPLASNEYDWKPERSASGPITMVVSAADKAIYVYRNGNVIGRAPVEVSGRGSLGNHVYSLLEGTTDRQSSLAPGRAARKWMTVTSSGRSVRLPTRSRRACASTPSLRPRFTTRSHRGRQSSLPTNRSCGAAAKPRSSRADH